MGAAAAGATGEMGGVCVCECDGATTAGEEEEEEVLFTFALSEIVVGESCLVVESCLSAPFIILLAACCAAV